MWRPYWHDGPFDFGTPGYLGEGLNLFIALCRSRFTSPCLPMNGFIAGGTSGWWPCSTGSAPAFNLRAIYLREHASRPGGDRRSTADGAARMEHSPGASDLSCKSAQGLEFDGRDVTIVAVEDRLAASPGPIGYSDRDRVLPISSAGVRTPRRTFLSRCARAVIPAEPPPESWILMPALFALS